MPSPISSRGMVTISGAGVRVERGHQDDRAREQREQAEPHDPPRRDVREKARDSDRGREQCQRERQEPRTGLERGQAQSDGQIERHDEEDTHLDEVLEEEHDQPAVELRVAQHGRAHERLLTP